MSIFSVDITVLNIKLPKLIWARYLVISCKFFNLFNFFLSFQQQLICLAQTVDFFVIDGNFMIQFQVFMKGLAANTVLKIYITTIIFKMLNDPGIRSESAILID